MRRGLESDEKHTVNDFRRVEIVFRPLSADDLPVIHEWINRPHVSAWWDSPVTFEDVQADYAPCLAADSDTSVFIAQLDGKAIGFIQSYVAARSSDGWWPTETDPGVRGIDQFLADEDALNRGLGTLMVRAFVARLFTDPAVTRIQTDPNPGNARAIRCYEKAGFERVGLVDTPDGPALLMYCERDRFAAADA
ncbi:MAG: GNAT family N-acetyltransferase [Gemmatimonadaceae bacterium]|nr:GNAT family N-acetyltransferase [Gemmatimonadaceae bacterium]